MCVRDGQGKDLPPPFEELMQQDEVSIEDQYSDHYLSDKENNADLDFSLPDARALLHVTSRRKFQSTRICLPSVCTTFLLTSLILAGKSSDKMSSTCQEIDELAEQHVGNECQTLEAEIQVSVPIYCFIGEVSLHFPTGMLFLSRVKKMMLKFID